jgi:hypothetical protein
MVVTERLNCSLGHEGLAQLYSYINELNFTTDFTVCSKCRDLLISKFGLLPRVDSNTLNSFLRDYYSAKTVAESATKTFKEMSSNGPGRKYKKDVSQIYQFLESLRRSVRVNKDIIGEDRAVGILKKAYEIEELLNV